MSSVLWHSITTVPLIRFRVRFITTGKSWHCTGQWARCRSVDERCRSVGQKGGTSHQQQYSSLRFLLLDETAKFSLMYKNKRRAPWPACHYSLLGQLVDWTPDPVMVSVKTHAKRYYILQCEQGYIICFNPLCPTATALSLPTTPLS